MTFNSQAYQLLVLENNLHQALERDQLTLYYQPVIEVATGRIVKMESLLRWQHPQLGIVSPNLFIPIAEENGLILTIGEWVLKTACTQNKIWQEMGLPPITIAVNLSARQFRNYNLLQTIKQILINTNLAPYWLELEITETTTMQNTKLAQQILFELNEMGIFLSMDDFGTGYSSLSYLKQFPFKTLKIDRSFIQDLSANSKDLAIINAITTLGRGLNLQVIAEGIDSHYLKDLMESLQCEYMQGYLFSPPLSSAEATNLLVIHSDRN